MTQEELKEEARRLYFITVANLKYRDNFVKELEKRTVIDKRRDGFTCSYCGHTLERPLMMPQMNRAIFPKNETEIWLVNTHYDGCRGWD